MKNLKFLSTAVICLLGLSYSTHLVADDEEKKGRNCIQTRTLKSTAVVDDNNVLFVKKGNTVYHNVLLRECKGLSDFRMFSYTTNSGSLCRQDKIQVVNGQGREVRACTLGEFYEISTDELRTLVQNSQKEAAKKNP